MGVMFRATPIGFAVGLFVLSAPESFAQRTKFESLRQCERQAAVQFRRHNPTFKHFMIDRSSVHEDKFADKIGIQFVSTIFYGKATLDSAFGPRLVRFICLHPGYGKEPIFVYTLPE